MIYLNRPRSQSPGGSDQDFAGGQQGRDVSARSDISADSIERNGAPPGAMAALEHSEPAEGQQRFDRAQARWLEELRARGAKVVQVTYPRTANNDKELTVIRGEYLEVNQFTKLFLLLDTLASGACWRGLSVQFTRLFEVKLFMGGWTK